MEKGGGRRGRESKSERELTVFHHPKVAIDRLLISSNRTQYDVLQLRA